MTETPGSLEASAFASLKVRTSSVESRCYLPHKKAQIVDNATAAWAARNLNDVDIGGRPLRVSVAESDPLMEGRTSYHGELLADRGGEPREPWSGRKSIHTEYAPRGGSQSTKSDAVAFMEALPSPAPLRPGFSCIDAVGDALANMSAAQHNEVLAQMKVPISADPWDSKTYVPHGRPL